MSYRIDKHTRIETITHSGVYERTSDEVKLINSIIFIAHKASDFKPGEVERYLRTDLALNYNALNTPHTFSRWLSKMRTEIKKVFNYDLDTFALSENYNRHIQAKPNKELVSMFKQKIEKCEEKIKEIEEDPHLSAADKAEKIARIQGIIDNLKDSIARQMNKTVTYYGMSR